MESSTNIFGSDNSGNSKGTSSLQALILCSNAVQMSSKESRKAQKSLEKSSRESSRERAQERELKRELKSYLNKAFKGHSLRGLFLFTYIALWFSTLSNKSSES